MVTPEDIAKAMAVHSVEEEPRRTRDDDAASQVLVDNERVQPLDQADDERDAGQGTARDAARTTEQDAAGGAEQVPG